MEIPLMRDEEQKKSQGKSTAKDVVSESASVAGSTDRAMNGRALRKDQHAAQKLARKKRLNAAHRRKSRAPHAKG